jgi:hypothetical protein
MCKPGKSSFYIKVRVLCWNNLDREIQTNYRMGSGRLPVLIDLLRRTHLDGSVQKEIILAPGHDGRRMDIVFQVAECSYHLDVARMSPTPRACPTCKTHAASKTKERKKNAKYNDLPGLAAGRGEGGMTPFVVESTGRLGPSALKFLN